MQYVTLIIDKRRELSVKYKKMLENSLSTVIISKSLLSAMKIIQDKEPDLIIISDSIDSDQCDYCKQIRALTYNMRPIIIALSKSAELQDRLNVLSSGADDFISEPVNSEEFLMRITAHLRRESESNLDNTTLLPNKNYTLRALRRTVTSKNPWGCLYITIENFKTYRETYTELASDKLVQTFCAIMQSALSDDDYSGCLSENEFIIITNPIKAEKIANFLTFAFDSVAPKFYSPQDKERGYIITEGDNQAGRRSGFVYLTIGVVTNEFKKYTDIKNLLTDLASIHHLANLPNRSNYLMERAKISGKDAIYSNVYNNKIVIVEPDEAMKVLLKTILELQGYEATVIENGEDISIYGNSPAVIILDAGHADNLKGLKICKTLRENSDFNNTKIIVTSIFHDKELILNCGADLYMPKPYEISTLVKWIKVFIDEVNY